MNYIRVLDMTNLFTKEILLYALFDIRFKSPVRIMLIVYILLLLLLWGVPLFFLFQNFINVYTVAIMIGPPIALGNLMSKPIWNGKSFFDWFTCQIKFLISPKIYYDNRPLKLIPSYKIDSQFTVSRSADFEELYLFDKQEKKMKKKRKVA